MVHALLVDGDASTRRALAAAASSGGLTVGEASTPEEARLEMREKPPDLVLVGLEPDPEVSLELIRELRDASDVPVVAIGESDDAPAAIEALRAGAADCLTRPLDARRLERVLAAQLRHIELRGQLVELRDGLRRVGRFGRLVGASAAMRRVYGLISKVAPTDSTVLLTGATGTGKDLVAQTVHELSERAERPFVPVNCGAIQASLIESELFGHEKGSFTGADRTHKGLFERASGGTLFLDEITEMSGDLQSKLLRVLETGRVRRVGGTDDFAVDVRVVAATNRDPQRAVADGALREDLYYRLMVFPIRLPPLSERKDDVELLATWFLEALDQEKGPAKTLSAEALEALEEHSWPGNVRELRNVVERAHILSGSTRRIGPEHVTIAGEGGGPARGTIEVRVGSTIAEAEKALVVATLEQCDGNKRKAAEVLGISVKTLYTRLDRYGMGSRSTRRGARA